jgi:hypothetical protein
VNDVGELKFNNGRTAVLCPKCRYVAATGRYADWHEIECPSCKEVFDDPRDYNYN